MITLTGSSISFKIDKLIVLFMTFHTLIMSSKHNTQELYITKE